jgi:hypothetical protein
VGRPYSPEREAALRKEAEERYAKRIPPGWEDRGKEDPAGDYLLWRQLVDEAGVRQLPVLLVTDDSKDDWVLRVKGRTVGPQPSLMREVREDAGVALFLTDVAGLLHLAPAALSATVSPETVSEVEAQGLEEASYRDRLRTSRLENRFAGISASEEAFRAARSNPTEEAIDRYVEALTEAFERHGVSDAEQEARITAELHFVRAATPADTGMPESPQSDIGLSGEHAEDGLR